ncbi:putative vomeronasal receptor-like protein 4 [Erinaceus europaeus]|uniref:Vomeronasal type-1 receptor n=1 Tax=Erinaceus europaeus TaxID=9365 RepID=A0A1S3A022_ERIEU|nr:putative vomeronasal receptor-like protein 4 [Erinaceus europaeus]
MSSFKNIIFLQIGIGISTNSFLLFFHILILILDRRPKPTDLTICHMACVHIMKLFAALYLMSPELFESLRVQNDVKCKALFYLSRVTRGLSICITCLLSVLQAITISPSTSWFAHFKHKSTSFTVHCFFCFWLLSLCLSGNILFYTVASSSNVTQARLLNVNKHCSLSSMHSIFQNLVFALTLPRDVVFVGIMLLSSSYMVLLLLRHQRRCRHLHGTSFSPRVSPERRATQTILLLVSFFVVIYWVDFILSSFLVLLWVYDPVIVFLQSFLVNIYVAISPLVLVSSDKRIIRIFQKVYYNCHMLPTFKYFQ